MTPERARSLGVNPADCRVTCDARRHGGYWIVWVPDDRRSGGEHVLFSSATPYAACRWLNSLDSIPSVP